MYIFQFFENTLKLKKIWSWERPFESATGLFLYLFGNILASVPVAQNSMYNYFDIEVTTRTCNMLPILQSIGTLKINFVLDT